MRGSVSLEQGIPMSGQWNNYKAPGGVFSPINATDAEDAAYAQLAYLNQQQTSQLVGYGGNTVSGGLYSGLGSLGGLMGGTSVASGAQGVTTTVTTNQSSGYYRGNQISSSTMITPTYISNTQWPSASIGSGVYPVGLSVIQDAFYRLLNLVELYAKRYTRLKHAPYDDHIWQMLDRRDFDHRKVSLTAFVSFLLCNNWSDFSGAVSSAEAYGVEWDDED